MSATTPSITRAEVFDTVMEFVNKVNSGDLQAGVDTHAPDCVVHFPGLPDMYMDTWVPFFYSYFQAFPDLKVHVNPDDAIIEGNRFAGRYRLSGTHLGDFMGIPATGNKIDISGINIFYVRDGKIVEEWDLNDALGMMQQLGIIPTPGAPTA